MKLFCYKLMFDFHAIPWDAIKNHKQKNRYQIRRNPKKNSSDRSEI